MTEDMIKVLGKQVNVIGEEMYFRNNSTNRPTLIHFVDESTAKTFCGFSHPFAQHVIGDNSDWVVESQCCKRCLKQMTGMQKLRNIQLDNKQRKQSV